MGRKIFELFSLGNCKLGFNSVLKTNHTIFSVLKIFKDFKIDSRLCSGLNQLSVEEKNFKRENSFCFNLHRDQSGALGPN